MKGKYMYLVYVLLLILVVLCCIIFIYKKPSEAKNNIQANHFSSEIIKNKEFVDISGFNINNFLNKKKEDRETIWKLSDKQLFNLLQNNKIEKRFKVNYLCNYLFLNKDSSKLEKCQENSYNFARRMIYILTYRTTLGGYGDPYDISFYKASYLERRKIFDQWYKNSNVLRFKCIYEKIKKKGYEPSCNSFLNEDFKDSILFFKDFLKYPLSNTEENYLKNIKLNTFNFDYSLSENDMHIILNDKCSQDKDCLFKFYNEMISYFLKKFKNTYIRQ